MPRISDNQLRAEAVAYLRQHFVPEKTEHEADPPSTSNFLLNFRTPPSNFQEYSPDEFNTLVMRALKKFHYPYDQDNLTPPTFLDHLAKVRLINVLLSPDVLLGAKLWWELIRLNRCEENLEGLPAHKRTVLFHKKMLNLLLGQAVRIRSLVEKQKAEEEWTAVLTAIDAQILKEVMAAFPDHPYLFLEISSYNGDRDRDFQLELYESLEKAFGSVRSDTKKTAAQVTALIYSLPECLTTNRLHLLPGTLSKAIQRSPKVDKTTSERH